MIYEPRVRVGFTNMQCDSFINKQYFYRLLKIFFLNFFLFTNLLYSTIIWHTPFKKTYIITFF